MNDMKKGSNWVTINKERCGELLWLAANFPRASGVLFFLFDQMDKHNMVTCSYKEMEDFCEISRSTLSRSIKVLEEQEFVQVVKAGRNNVYVVNTDIACIS